MKSIKRITFEIPEEWHQKIKARAALQGKTITDWVFEAIVKLAREEDNKEFLGKDNDSRKFI